MTEDKTSDRSINLFIRALNRSLASQSLEHWTIDTITLTKSLGRHWTIDTRTWQSHWVIEQVTRPLNKSLEHRKNLCIVKETATFNTQNSVSRNFTKSKNISRCDWIKNLVGGLLTLTESIFSYLVFLLRQKDIQMHFFLSMHIINVFDNKFRH